MIEAELISIGDELLIGQTVNTNATWLGQQLAAIGIRVIHTAVTTDERQAIVSAFDAAFERASLIIVTGGLGPTKDDITKHVLCEYFDTRLVMNEPILEHITSFFTKRNRPMLEVNRQQAALPEACTVLFNRQGTAAGMWFDRNGKVLISMPGVPYEMKSIFSEEALPKILERFQTVGLYHRTLLTQGVGESFLAETLADWENRLRADGLGLAYLPSPGVVKLRITAYAGEIDAAKVDRYLAEAKKALPVAVYGEEEETLQEVVGKLLRERGQTIGTVESCTGGAITALLTSISGSSDYVQGGLVTYSNQLKQELANVRPETLETFGAVSEETVTEMALGGQKKLGVDWCISVSGIAGPLGGSEEKPVGTVWIGIAGPKALWTKQFSFGDNRERNVQMSVLAALNFVRCALLGIIPEKKML
ncbi:MAG TPA: competence/damage-inducible protein A [Fluviicola sp.]|nr:competence/damage-inducible protein A [Fluviicola sp.]